MSNTYDNDPRYGSNISETKSHSYSKTGTKSDTKTDTKSHSDSKTGTKSDTKSHSYTNSKSHSKSVSQSGTDDYDPDPHKPHDDDCIMGQVDFTDKKVDAHNFFSILPDGIMITADNVGDGDKIFTMEEVGFIDRGGPLHKGIGADGKTIPANHVDTQTGYDIKKGEGEELKIEFKGDEFPDGIMNITLFITRLFPNEGTGNDNESFRWTTFKDGSENGTGTYEASNSDPKLYGASHAVAVDVDPPENFDTIILTAIRYNNDDPANGGATHDSSDFLLAGFEYKYSIPPENKPPHAKDDWADVCEDMPTKIDVLNNDKDPDGDPLTIISFSQPTNGTVMLMDGKLLYTPDKDFHGIDEFTYTISDGKGGKDSATVDIAVLPKNDDPMDPNERKMINEDQLIKGVSMEDFKLKGAKDVDGDDIDVKQLNGGTVKVIIDGNDESGNFSVEVNGLEAVLKMGNDAIAKFIVDGETGSEEISSLDDDFWNSLNDGDYVQVKINYTVTDGNGGEDTSKQTITIKGKDEPNRDPEDPNERKMVNEDQLIKGVSMDDFKLKGAVDPDGDDIDIASLDGGVVTATIDGVDESGSFSVVINGFEADLLKGGAVVATFIVDAETGGEQIVSKDDDFWNSLSDGDFVRVKVNYTVTDGNGGTDTSMQTVTIKGKNDAPKDPNEKKTIDEDELIAGVSMDDFKLKGATDADGDDIDIASLNNGIVTASIGGVDESGSFNVVINGFEADLLKGGAVVATFIVDEETGGEKIVSKDDDFWESLDGSDFVRVKITYTVTDGNGGTNNSMQTITIKGVDDINNPPDARDDWADTCEDEPVKISVLLNDSDPDGDPLTIIDVTDPANGTVMIMGGQIVYTPNENFHGVDMFEYTISDGNGGTDTALVDIIVIPKNDDPVDPDERKDINEDQLISVVSMDDFKLAGATDPDGDDLDVESLDDWDVMAEIGGQDVKDQFSVVLNGFNIEIYRNTGSGDELVATFVVDPETGGEVLSSNDDDFWNSLDEGDFVEVKVNYTVTDGNGGTDTSMQTIRIDGVKEPNRPPEDPDEMKTVTEDEVIAGVSMDEFKLVGATDPDGDDLDIQSLDDWEVVASIGGLDLSPQFSVMFDGFDAKLFRDTGTGPEQVGTFSVNPETGGEVITSDDDDFWNSLEITDFIRVKIDYTVTDGEFTDESTQTITIKGAPEEVINKPPVAVDDLAVTVEGVSTKDDATPMGAPFVGLEVDDINVLANDSDPDGDPIQIVASGPGNFGTTAIDDMGTADPADDRINYTPEDGFVGYDSFDYEIQDVPGGLSDFAQVRVMVSKTYDLNESFPVNGTNNKHHSGKDGLLGANGLLVAPPAPFDDLPSDAINIINGKDPLIIAPTGLGLALSNTEAHVSSLDFASTWTVNGTYSMNLRTTPFFDDPMSFLNNAGQAEFVSIAPATNTKLLVNFTDELSNNTGFVVTLGTDASETLTGDTPNQNDQDLIYGFLGDDEIEGGNDDDVIYGDQKISTGQPGDDKIMGGDGRDLIYGDNLVLEGGFAGGADEIYGGEGDDVIWGDARFRGMSDGGEDIIEGGNGRDLIYGDGAILRSFSTAAKDIIYGDNDDGGTGDDDIYGDAFLMIGGTGVGDELYGGGGTDTIYGDAKRVIADNEGQEPIASTSADDIIRGDDGTDFLYGDAEQIIESFGGNDDIEGGDGNDNLYGDGGVVIDPNTLLVTEAGFIDSIAGNDNLRGGAGDDMLFGDAEIAQQTGGGIFLAGDDTLEGGTGDDMLWGDFFLVWDGSGIGSDITDLSPNGQDRFVYDFDGANTDLGDDEIFDFDLYTIQGVDGDILVFDDLLDAGGVDSVDSIGDLVAVTSVAADADGIQINFDANDTTITFVGTAFAGGEITDYNINVEFA